MSDRKKTQTKQEAAPTAAPVETKGGAGPLMYVGPTVTGLAIQNQVYSEIPKEAEALFLEHPEVRNLFIPVRDYPKANRMIRERAGYIYSAYLSALELRR